LDYSNKYIVTFAAVLCLVCSAIVSTVAVGLKEKQDINKLLDKRTMVLRVANLIESGDKPNLEQVNQYFEKIEAVVIDRKTGAILEVDPTTVDPRKQAKAAGVSSKVSGQLAKRASLKSVADKQLVYLIHIPGKESVVFPIYGNGLWSTMYGFLCLKPSLEEVVGIIYYEQGETAGLGGEVENPRWLAQWPGKKGVDSNNKLQVEVVKGGLAKDKTRQIDGISGATITSVAVSHMLRFWFSEDGYGPALNNIREAALDHN
jgi:Na+-transporting NADH:ubiquinone oxidoreductase subunit C